MKSLFIEEGINSPIVIMIQQWNKSVSIKIIVGWLYLIMVSLIMYVKGQFFEFKTSSVG
jgi:hypothetical protein